MAKTALNQFDRVSSGNTDVDNVNVGPGMTVDNTNDAFQHLMSLLAQAVGPIGAQSTDIASAAITDLTNANGWSVNITGTNAISDLGGSSLYTGAIYWLTIVNGLTLTYGATKILTPGAANLALGAGDKVTVVHRGSGKWEVINAYAASGSGVPTATIVDYGGTTAPGGWLLCNGQAVSRTGYPSLFTVVGTSFGTGDGSTTFNVPDLRGRVTAGRDTMGATAAGRLALTIASPDTVGSSGGADTIQLFIGEMPSHDHGGITGWMSADHSHGVNINTGTESAAHTHSLPTNYLGPWNGVNNDSGAGNNGSFRTPTTGDRSAVHYHNVSGNTGGSSANHYHSIPAQGGGAPHNNMPPALIVSKIIKT